MGRIKGDLLDRSYEFALAILRLADNFPTGQKAWTIQKQVIRSGTSIGANVCEADGALTAREFAHLVNVARREALETSYWLRLCRDAKIIAGDAIQELIDECGELIRILASIVKRTTRSLP